MNGRPATPSEIATIRGAIERDARDRSDVVNASTYMKAQTLDERSWKRLVNGLTAEGRTLLSTMCPTRWREWTTSEKAMP